MIQNLWNSAKAVLRGKFIAIQSYLKKQQQQQNTSNLIPESTEKSVKKNPQIRRRKEMIQIRAERHEKETKDTIVKINKTKSWFFENINTIDKPLARFIKKKREKNQINKIRNEKGEVTTYNAEIQRITGDYYEQLYGNKMNNLEEMDRF